MQSENIKAWKRLITSHTVTKKSAVIENFRTVLNIRSNLYDLRLSKCILKIDNRDCKYNKSTYYRIPMILRDESSTLIIQ